MRALTPQSGESAGGDQRTFPHFCDQETLTDFIIEEPAVGYSFTPSPLGPLVDGIRDRSSLGPLDSVPSRKMARHVHPGHTPAVESHAAGAQRARQARARAGRAGRLPAGSRSRAAATARGGHAQRHVDFDTLARPSMMACKRTARSNGSPACAQHGRKKNMSIRAAERSWQPR